MTQIALNTIIETVESYKENDKTAVYRNNLKNREFGEEASQIFMSGASEPRGPRRRFVGRGEAIALEQGASEDQKDAAKPTTPKTGSSGCFGIALPTFSICLSERDSVIASFLVEETKVTKVINNYNPWGPKQHVHLENGMILLVHFGKGSSKDFISSEELDKKSAFEWYKEGDRVDLQQGRWSFVAMHHTIYGIQELCFRAGWSNYYEEVPDEFFLEMNTWSNTTSSSCEKIKVMDGLGRIGDAKQLIFLENGILLEIYFGFVDYKAGDRVETNILRNYLILKHYATHRIQEMLFYEIGPNHYRETPEWSNEY